MIKLLQPFIFPITPRRFDVTNQLLGHRKHKIYINIRQNRIARLQQIEMFGKVRDSSGLLRHWIILFAFHKQHAVSDTHIDSLML